MFSLPKMLFLLPMVLVLAYRPTASSQTFTNPARVATPVDPDTVVAGDLNGDGRVDLIWFNLTSPTSIGHTELAQADGSYLAGPQVTIPDVLAGVPMCAAADVTRDGKVDLICATLDTTSETSTVIVFPGNGDGSFGTPISSLFDSQYGEGIILTLVGDLNADGVPDFILENDYYNSALVLLSDGKGGFLPTKTVPNSYNFSVPVAADINGDGIPDILWPEGAGVALGKGDGSFGDLITPYPSTSTLGPITCAFHDMDGDGKLDALCGYLANNGIAAGTAFDILQGNGDGTFNPSPIAHQTFGSASIALSGSGDFLMPLLIRDLNGDGIPDVLAFSGDGLAVLLGQTGLTFQAPLHYAPAFSGYAFSSQVAAQSVYTDLNGDGLIDVLDAGPNGLYLLYGRADGSFDSAVATKVSEVNGHIAVADFNNDGKPDIVSIGAPATSISLGTGDGGFSAPVTVPGSPFTAGSLLYVADFNGDGNQDILSYDASSTYYLMLGKGDGTFAAAVATTGLPTPPSFTSIQDGSVIPYALTADLNADGLADLFSITSSSSSSTYGLVSSLSAGDGTFHTLTTNYPAPVFVASSTYFTPIAPALADFAHRGSLDAAYFLNNNLYVVQGNGDGSFAATPSILAVPTVAGVPSDYFEALRTADFDGDGNPDIAFLAWFEPVGFLYQGGPSCVFIYYGKGDGTFDSPAQAGCFTHAYTDLRVADFNGDGRPDIVLQTASELNVYAVGIIDNLGNRSFGPETNYTAGSLSGDIFVADLNGDGRPDLVFGNQRYEAGYSANSVTVLLNETVPVATGALISIPNPSYVGQAFTITTTLRPPFPGTTYAGAITFYVDGSAIGSTTLSRNIATIAGPTTLVAGTHQISATWPGDANDPSLALNATQTVLPNPLQITLTCSPNPSTLGQSVLLASQFTATPPPGLPAAGASYSGTLAFYDGTTLLEQQPVASQGFSYSTSALTGGAHTLFAKYSGDSVYADSSASCSETVDKLPTTSTLSLSLVPVAGMPFQLTAKVAPVSTTGIELTGTVSFLVDGSPVGSGNVDPATGTAAYTDAGISAGSHSLSCSYGGDANFAGSLCAPVSTAIAPAPAVLSLGSSANPAAAGTPILFTSKLSANNKPLPGYVVTFTVSANGVAPAQISATTDANGNATYSSPGLPPGNYAVSSSFAGNADLESAVSPTLMQVVAINPTSTALIASPNPGYAGNSVTLTSTVTAMGTANSVPPVPPGNVAFFDGTSPLGSAALNASGVATLTTSLGVGVHSLSASYAASTLFAGSISPTFTETILASTFTIAIAPSTITIASAKAGMSTINLASVGLFAGPLTLTHGAPPEYGTVTINPSTVTLTADGTGSSTITFNTLDTDAKTMATTKATSRALVAFPAAMLLLLPLTCRRHRLSKTLLLAIAAVLMQGLIGCGNHFYIAHTVAPGTYIVPVTATDTNGDTQTADMTVIVVP